MSSEISKPRVRRKVALRDDRESEQRGLLITGKLGKERWYIQWIQVNKLLQDSLGKIFILGTRLSLLCQYSRLRLLRLTVLTSRAFTLSLIRYSHGSK